ncbi:MAG: hypothetical protein A3H35_14935 [Betaproteobacteria bacterium RIFCSPLOWO2_02_FULL_62_17]|nr:MAG: hypothetical protein A3H35_14935 [Betaproteobacteria bacterium RIFCSPLOWO2_02_FULL_62_17]
MSSMAQLMTLVFVLVSMLYATSAGAQSVPAAFPVKPITVVHPQATGGPVDITTRLVAQKAGEYMGRSVLVEARPGAGGTISAMYVKQANPDGYTLLLGNHVSLAVNVTLMPNLPYDPLKHFVPVTLLWNNPTLMTVSASSPARNLRELIAIAQQAPDKVSYATAGIGTTGHLAGHMLAAAVRSTMVHVPYKGSVEAIGDLMSGRVDTYIGSYASVATYHKAGKIRLLAAVSEKRNAIAPDVPTIVELGYPGIHFDGWFGILAPAGTAQAVVQRLQSEFVKAVTSPEVHAKLASQGTVTMTSASPAEFGTFIAGEIIRLGRAAKLSGATAD